MPQTALMCGHMRLKSVSSKPFSNSARSSAARPGFGRSTGSSFSSASGVARDSSLTVPFSMSSTIVRQFFSRYCTRPMNSLKKMPNMYVVFLSSRPKRKLRYFESASVSLKYLENGWLRMYG